MDQGITTRGGRKAEPIALLAALRDPADAGLATYQVISHRKTPLLGPRRRDVSLGAGKQPIFQSALSRPYHGLPRPLWAGLLHPGGECGHTDPRHRVTWSQWGVSGHPGLDAQQCLQPGQTEGDSVLPAGATALFTALPGSPGPSGTSRPAGTFPA